MITITSKRDGFRRCGMAHPTGPVEYPDSRFTKAQLKELQAEPMLTVTVTPDPDPAAEAKAKAEAAHKKKGKAGK